MTTHVTQEPFDSSRARLAAHVSAGTAEDKSTPPDLSAKYPKRARHKTKADTYEYKGTKKAKTSTRKRKRKGSLGNDNFHAANIDAERVTLKPSYDKFVFGRSRESLPLPGQDLPDLTFTKMTYLLRPPNNVHLGSAQAVVGEEDEEYISRKDRGENLIRSIPTGASRHQKAYLISDQYSSKFTKDKSRNTRVYRSLSKDIDKIPGQSIEDSKWIKSEADPRVEEFCPLNAHINSSTPVSWSVSPSRHFKHSVLAGGESGQGTRSLSRQEYVSVRGRPDQSHTRSRRNRSSDYCDRVSRNLLGRRSADNHVTSSCWSEAKGYYTIEDLKFMASKTFEEGPIDDFSALRRHVRSRGLSLSGQKTQLAPSPVHGPPAYIDDVIMQHHDHKRSLARGPIHHFQEFECYQSAHEENEDVQLQYAQREAHNSGWPTLSNYMPEQQRECALQHKQVDELLPYFMTNSQPASNVSYAMCAKPRISLQISGSDAAYGNTAERQLDAFDLELLEKVMTVRTIRGSQSAGGPRTHEPDCVTWNDSAEPDCGTERAAQWSPAPLVPSPSDKRLLQLQDGRTVLLNEPGLRLRRPSLHYKSTEQHFNPFGRPQMLL